jgi:hypothetical protein
MRVYSGSAWITAYLPAAGYLALTGGTMTGAITFAAGQFGTNINTFLSTPSSANLAAALTDETGTGLTVFNNTPTLITPILGTPQSGNLANCTFPTLNQNTTGTAANLTAATTLPSGMTLVAPLLGTPASGTLTNCTVDVTNGVGYKNIPQTGSDKTTAYTLVTGDVGKYVGVGTSGSIVVPTSTFANGNAISVYNNTTGNITITTSAPTAYIGGTNTVKTSITLATRGIATILFVSSTVCVVTGNVS